MKIKYLCLLLLPWGLQAQSKPYFQQEVHYTIAVSLNDQRHQVEGVVEFEYVNHSPDTLSYIWVHLWGNAFKNRETAFCRQKLREGNTRFYFSKPAEKGYYDKLDFSADGQKTTWRLDEKYPDIARVELLQPLTPGARVRLKTPFLLKIPASFSRLGHVGTSYQMTQWYPKPAVYDHKGWHAMPYLDIGEFYSEFGSFDVQITLPENYVVGATGALQTPAEIAFLHQKEQESRATLAKGLRLKDDSFPPSSPTLKTIRFTADRVHDFAWFADKRFHVLKDTARLASGKTVDCWAMFTNAQSDIWQKGAFYVRRAVEFYSNHVGEYPWPQATAVHSALSAGGGMEYPMITVIGNSSSAKDLDDVITHEVGHNWFYGILASHERNHPFMDEGLNSYYEQRYMKTYYGAYEPVALPEGLYNAEKSGNLLENAYLLLARDRKDVPPDSHSDRFNAVTYGLQVYMKTALCLYWLEQAVGTEQFDRAMQAYYGQWQFKHPYPEDLLATLSAHGVPAAWFLRSMQTQAQADYAIKSLEQQPDRRWALTVRQKGDLAAPLSVHAVKDGKSIGSKWYWDFVSDSTQGQQQREKILYFNAVDADAFELDRAHVMLEFNRKNDLRRTSGMFPGVEPFQLRFFPLFQQMRRNTLGVFPWLAYNNAGKTMLGVALFNPPLPPRALQFVALPGYAFGSKHWVGFADVRYRFYPGGFIPKAVLSLGFKTFDLSYHPETDQVYRFYRVMPQLRADLPAHPAGAFRHWLNLRTLFIGRENSVLDTDGTFVRKGWRRYNIHEIRYQGHQKGMPRPFTYQIALEGQADRGAALGRYLRTTLEWRQQWYYGARKKFTYRFFTGYFINNENRNGPVQENAFALNPQGFNDYKFDQIFAARLGGGGILGRQVTQTDGGFKGAFGDQAAALVGNSNHFVCALNLKADLPLKLPLGLPLKPYFDIGYFANRTPDAALRPASDQWCWNGGFAFELFNGGFELYFPLVSSENLRTQYCNQAGGRNSSAFFCDGNYFKTISWSIRINMGGDPISAVSRLAQ